MTVDNLAERGIHKPLDCKFCSEKESIHHLFFDCIIARQLWAYLSDFNGSVINSYFDMASKWIAPKKYKSTNTISAGVVWCLWLIRNDFVFRGQHWSSIKMVLGKLWSIMKEWMIMCPTSMEVGGGYQPMVQLVGGSSQDPLGNWRMKKLKLAPKKLDSAEV